MRFDEVAELLAAMQRRGVRFVLVGGMAMAAQGIVRATQDIDAFTFADIESETVDISGVMVPVATARILFEMKRGTLRPQDRADAEALRERFDLED